jgi:NAD-dependent dihydropyrimidine dehydrogenase PreA subunit
MRHYFSIELNFELCDGCGYCLEVCPEALFDLGTELNSKGCRPPVVARPNDCLGCLNCRLSCPNCCLKVKRSMAESLEH